MPVPSRYPRTVAEWGSGLTENPVFAIGGKAHVIPCAGNPNRPGAILNECPNAARYVVVATQIILDADAGPVAAIVGACDQHVLGVQAWMRDRAMDTAAMLGEEYTQDDEPAVFGSERVGELVEHFGGMAWIATRTA